MSISGGLRPPIRAVMHFGQRGAPRRMFVYHACSSMNARSLRSRRWYRRLLQEPMVHFVLLGVLLFVVHGWMAGDPRQIVVTPSVKADLARRFQDAHGRPPSPGEQHDIFQAWKRDEALYREALRRKLERNDVTIRTLLIEKMREEALLEVSVPEPSEQELVEFLHAQRSRYEVPLRYDFQLLTFPRADPRAEQELIRALRALRSGAQPSELGRPVVGGQPTEADLPKLVAPPLEAHIASSTSGQWTRVEGDSDLWLVRVRGTTGGLPALSEVRSQVIADWKLAKQQEAIARELDKTAQLYQFKEVGDAE